MKKPLKLYIDTSIWNFVLESDRIESILTKKFLDLHNYDNSLFISDVVKAEIRNAYDIRRKLLVKLLEEYKIKTLEATDDSYNLAKVY